MKHSIRTRFIMIFMGLMAAVLAAMWIVNNFLNEEDQEMTVTLILDDDTEVECTDLTVFNAGGREYMALHPVEGADPEDGEVYLYRYSETEDGGPALDNIEDDDEYEIAADAYDELPYARKHDGLVGKDGPEEE